jgi:hypothetical protein
VSQPPEKLKPTTYNPCPPSQPFQHCKVFGICYCSAYP